MKRRIVALMAALLLAGAGTFVLVGFVRGAADRATAGEELVTVYIVGSPVPKGTAGESLGDFVHTEQIPLRLRAPEAMTDLVPLTGLVAEVDLIVGEQVLATRFVLPGEADLRREDLPDRRVVVPEGMLELPIRFATEQALGGIIDAGDMVAIVASFASYEAPGGDVVEVEEGLIAIPASAAGPEDSTTQATAILIHNALVVEVQADATPLFTPEDEQVVGAVLAPTTSFIITFALSPRDVERLVYAAEYGSLWLAAQTADDTGPTAVVTLDGIFEADDT